jgi:hypothetical protein
MLNKTEALEIVSKKLQQISTLADPFVVVEENTMEKPFAWIFFYNSKKFIDTGISRYRLAGNGPIFVNKATRAVEFCGTDKPLEMLIDDYEKKYAGSGS